MGLVATLTKAYQDVVGMPRLPHLRLVQDRPPRVVLANQVDHPIAMAGTWRFNQPPLLWRLHPSYGWEVWHWSGGWKPAGKLVRSARHDAIADWDDTWADPRVEELTP